MISAHKMTKMYHNKKVLNQISFDLSYGDMVGLVGPYGVGKTTLLSAMMGVTPLDDGHVIIADISFKETEMYRSPFYARQQCFVPLPDWPRSLGLRCLRTEY